MDSATGYQNELWPDNCGLSSPMMSPRRLPLQSTMTGGKQEIPDMATALRHRSVTSASISAPTMNCSERMRQDYMNRMTADNSILHMDSPMVITGELKQSHGRVLRPHSTPATLMWLEENYEVAEGVCIPRSTLYMHYVDFCAKNFMQPVNAASFGKIIRQQFSQLTTRRLGTRGQSRYHYYGIAVRETSPYFQLSFSKKGASRILFIRCTKSGRNIPFPHLLYKRGRHVHPGIDVLLKTCYNSEGRLFKHVDTMQQILESARVYEPHRSSVFDIVPELFIGIIWLLNCETRREVVKQVPLYSPRTRAGTVLPDFPRVKDLNLPPAADVEKITTFLMMYRTHCQRVLDTVIRASFDEVQNFLLHFWQGMPPHLVSILETNALVNLVGVCDCILYRTISNVLLPSMLQTLPDSLTKVVRRFVQELDCWLKMAMANMPENLKTVKLHMASRFAQMLRRQMSLNHLAQASRMVVHNSDITGQMLHDWRQVDLDAICRETLYSTEQNYNGTTFELILKLSKDFETLLEEEVPIDSYVEWLESLVNKCVVMPTARGKASVRRLARQFLLMWSAFGTRVIRDMTLHSAASFGSFHLLRLMFDDYVLFLVEAVHTEDQMKDFMRNIVNDTPPQFTESFGEYPSIPYGREIENQAYSSTTVLPDQYACDTEQGAVSPPAQEVPSSSTQPEYEDSATADEEQLTASCTWMPGEYYPSFYQGGNYDPRRSWPSSTVFPRTENKPYNYQQATQYVIVSQENDRVERESCRSTAGTGYDYGSHFASSRQEEAMVPSHEHSTTPSIMYSASGAIYQSYTVVTSPFHNQPHEKDPETYRERAVDKPRVHHHVTVRMDGTVFCDA